MKKFFLPFMTKILPFVTFGLDKSGFCGIIKAPKIPFGLLERYTFVEAKKLHNFGRGSCPKGRKKAPPPQDAESAQASIKVYLFGGAVGTRKARPIRLLQMSDLRPCNGQRQKSLLLGGAVGTRKARPLPAFADVRSSALQQFRNKSLLFRGVGTRKVRPEFARPKRTAKGTERGRGGKSKAEAAGGRDS